MSSVAPSDLDMDVIALKVFPVSLIGDATIWFSTPPYNSITTWDGLHRVFLAKYFSILKKMKLKDKIHNFMDTPRELISDAWERFTDYMSSVSNHWINDESLNKYINHGIDDNGKVVLDTIFGGPYGEKYISRDCSKVGKYLQE